jgi:hypothetical protein
MLPAIAIVSRLSCTKVAAMPCSARRLALAATLALLPLFAAPAVAAPGPGDAFAARFHDATLRIDLHHLGDADHDRYVLDRVLRQGPWAGPRTGLVDPLSLGRYRARLIDPTGGEILFSRGYDTYCGEYRTTAPARDGTWRVFQESVLVPCPRQAVDLVILRRDPDDGTLTEIFRTRIDPDADTVAREPLATGVVVHVAHRGAAPASALDVAILGEGYTRAQTGEFTADVERFTAALLAHEPFASRRDRISVRGVLQPSQDSGCDEPGRGVFARTALGCTFGALGSPRYLLTSDDRAVRDLAAHVPADAVAIMVNHDRYGGGGIYNAFCTFTSDNQWSEYVFIHEFGHHFGGLADEYYTAQIAYLDLYPRDREPAEPNITILADPAALKWRDAVAPGTPLPTPWDKATYDRHDTRYQERRAALNDRIAARMRAGADTAEVAALKQQAEDLSRTHQAWVDSFFAASPWSGVVGAYEGAGYTSEGMYRAELDCIMFSKGLKPFCAACRAHLAAMIDRAAGRPARASAVPEPPGSPEPAGSPGPAGSPEPADPRAGGR